MNKVILMGNVGMDPEIFESKGGNIAKFSLATSEKYKDKVSGELIEKTQWHRCVVFGRQADIIKQYVFKGSRLLIEDASIEYGKYKDKDGVEKYSTDIKVQRFRLLDKKGEGQPKERKAPSPPQQEADDHDDDIPF